VGSAVQIWAFVLLAVVGGWVASVFTAFNTWLCLVRKKWSKFFSFRILEVTLVSTLHNASQVWLQPPACPSAGDMPYPGCLVRAAWPAALAVQLADPYVRSFTTMHGAASKSSVFNRFMFLLVGLCTL